MISALLALLFPAILAGGPGGTATTLAEVAGASAALARPSAVVDARYAGADGALVGGVPTFRTITAAVAAAPPGSSAYVVYIKDGRYREKLQVNRAHVICDRRIHRDLGEEILVLVGPLGVGWRALLLESTRDDLIARRGDALRGIREFVSCA